MLHDDGLPTTAASQPTHEIVVDQHAKVPVRDGTLLDAIVWRPKAPGQYPVIVERVAYELVGRCSANAEFFARRGYAFVGQSVRGIYASEGVYGFWRDDAWGANRDGYDTVEWAGTQPWSSGAVGMIDGSYSGCTQYMVAPTRPPHLKALFVRQGPPDAYRAVYRGGAYKLSFILGACMMHMAEDVLNPQSIHPEEERVRIQLRRAVENLDFWMRHLPLKEIPPLLAAQHHNVYFEQLEHPEDGAFWWPLSLASKYHEVDVPIYHLDGWFDCWQLGTLAAYRGIRACGRTADCRQNQRLLVGPWPHGPEHVGRRRAGELDFGPQAASFDLRSAWLAWYDHWLKGIENGVMDGPHARVFLMGHNRWLDLDDWPPREVSDTPLYLRQGSGASAGSLNDGLATFEPPDLAERADNYVYDPDDPIPSVVGYPDYGPQDFRPLEGRLLTYTTAPLERDLAVVGSIKAVLYGLSTAPDTDWVVRLCDVYPDGRSMSVCDGILRARYRNSLARQELMIPGQVYRFEVELLPTAQVFLAGHRIRVQVTSSDFPRYDRNLNTGGPFGEEVRGQVAINTIFHDRMRPSHLVLPAYPLEDRE